MLQMSSSFAEAQVAILSVFGNRLDVAAVEDAVASFEKLEGKGWSAEFSVSSAASTDVTTSRSAFVLSDSSNRDPHISPESSRSGGEMITTTSRGRFVITDVTSNANIVIPISERLSFVTALANSAPSPVIIASLDHDLEMTIADSCGQFDVDQHDLMFGSGDQRARDDDDLDDLDDLDVCGGDEDAAGFQPVQAGPDDDDVLLVVAVRPAGERRSDIRDTAATVSSPCPAEKGDGVPDLTGEGSMMLMDPSGRPIHRQRTLSIGNLPPFSASDNATANATVDTTTTTRRLASFVDVIMGAGDRQDHDDGDDLEDGDDGDQSVNQSFARNDVPCDDQAQDQDERRPWKVDGMIFEGYRDHMIVRSVAEESSSAILANVVADSGAAFDAKDRVMEDDFGSGDYDAGTEAHTVKPRSLLSRNFGGACAQQ